MSATSGYYNVNTASPADLNKMQLWSQPFRPSQSAWRAHVVFSAVELIGSAALFLRQNGKALSFFGSLTTTQKCLFVMLQVVVIFSLFLHRKIMNKNERVAFIKGIKEHCRNNLKNDQYTIIQKDGGTYAFTNSSVTSHAKFLEYSNSTRLVNTHVFFESLIKDKKEKE